MTTESGEYGQVTGSGTERVYITKEGDMLADVAGFFYGDAAHRQRLLDDNPELAQGGVSDPLPAGMRLRIPEDPERGDAVASS